MKTKQIVVLLTVLALALPLGAQMGMGPRMPDMSGIWHPVVGSGGAYEMTDHNGVKTQMEMTIVGKEDVAGKPGFWMEMAMSNPRASGQIFMKYLVAPGDAGERAARAGQHDGGAAGAVACGLRPADHGRGRERPCQCAGEGGGAADHGSSGEPSFAAVSRIQ